MRFDFEHSPAMRPTGFEAPPGTKAVFLACKFVLTMDYGQVLHPQRAIDAGCRGPQGHLWQLAQGLEVRNSIQRDNSGFLPMFVEAPPDRGEGPGLEFECDARFPRLLHRSAFLRLGWVRDPRQTPWKNLLRHL